MIQGRTEFKTFVIIPFNKKSRRMEKLISKTDIILGLVHNLKISFTIC